MTSGHLEVPGPEAAVLVIDPDPASAAALRPVLADAGLAGRVDHAPSLAEGLDALARGPYLLVLLALATGDAEGVESLARIRAVDPAVPVVLTSDVDDRNLARAALRRGAQDFALKEDLAGRAAVRILGHAVERQRILLELQESRRREQYLATHDPLTGVPNRTLFYDRLEQALAAADRYRTTLAVLFVDLDGFKAVNDELGHEAGDELLREVARRVSGLVRKSDTVARVGGDEFTIVLNQIGRPEDAARVARNLIERLSVPVRLAGEERHVAASIGIAVHPGDGEAADTLVRNADAAMYAAKRAGGGRYVFHDRGAPRDDEPAS